MISWWLENGMTLPSHDKHTLVDMGDVEDQRARDATDEILQALGRRNVQVIGAGRITVRLPPRRRDAILKRFPQIVEGAARYCWCSHGWTFAG